MAQTIGNPLSWTAQHLAQAGSHAAHSAGNLGPHEDIDALRVAHLTRADLVAALRAGMHDVAEARSDVLFLCILYPVIGLALAFVGLHARQMHLLFPLIAGFALIGPLAAVGLYEVSRQRDSGQPAAWFGALGVLRSPRFPAIVVLGLYHLAVFVLWLVVAQAIYAQTLGPEVPTDLTVFLRDALTTGPGLTMVAVGCAVGLGFALVVLATSAVSYPALLDRRLGVAGSVVLSLRVFRRNPGVMCLWGLIIAVSLAIGAIPALVGLVVVMPVLGHATWHLYRRAVY